MKNDALEVLVDAFSVEQGTEALLCLLWKFEQKSGPQV